MQPVASLCRDRKQAEEKRLKDDAEELEKQVAALEALKLNNDLLEARAQALEQALEVHCVAMHACHSRAQRWSRVQPYPAQALES
jgi:hypothetical protein